MDDRRLKSLTDDLVSFGEEKIEMLKSRIETGTMEVIHQLREDEIDIIAFSQERTAWLFEEQHCRLLRYKDRIQSPEKEVKKLGRDCERARAGQEEMAKELRELMAKVPIRGPDVAGEERDTAAVDPPTEAREVETLSLPSRVEDHRGLLQSIEHMMDRQMREMVSQMGFSGANFAPGQAFP